MYAGSKAFFYALSRSALLKRLASRYGLRTSESFASRFIAGETIETAITASKRLQAQGFLITLDHLGEGVGTLEAVSAATREYVRLINVIVASGIERNISLKLTQLGIDIDRATCVDNLRRILEPASRCDFFVRIDMENSAYTERTLEIFETLWEQQYRNVGVALQAYLLRTERDVQRMNELGARVRLVKGAYKEPAAVAYQRSTPHSSVSHGSCSTTARIPRSPHTTRTSSRRCVSMPQLAGWPRTGSSFRCCTGFVVTCRRHLLPAATRCA